MDSNGAALYQWVAQWADVIELKVTPCVDDSEAGPVLAAMSQRRRLFEPGPRRRAATHGCGA